MFLKDELTLARALPSVSAYVGKTVSDPQRAKIIFNAKRQSQQSNPIRNYSNLSVAFMNINSTLEGHKWFSIVRVRSAS